MQINFVRLTFFGAALLLAGCSGGGDATDAGPTMDGGPADGSGHDAGSDAGRDAGTDAGRDAGGDAGPSCTSGCNVVEITAGFRHSCARRANGTVLCWGRNYWGELGDGRMSHGESCLIEGGMAIDCSSVPVPVTDLSDAMSLKSHSCPSTCSIKADGTYACWGWAFIVPTGMAEPTVRRTATAEPLLAGALSAAPAFVDLCQVRADHSVGCMGGNGSGEVGDGTRTQRIAMVDALVDATAVPPVRVENASTVAMGGHTCALLMNGHIQCWGENSSGALGDGVTAHSSCVDGSGTHYDCTSTAVTVATIDDATQVDVGDGYTCAIRADHTVWCWGAGGFGQLGDGDITADHNTPIQVTGITNAMQLSTGSDTACVVLSDGTAKCWGLNHHGTLGDGPTAHTTCTDSGSSVDCSGTPVTVMGISDATQIAVGTGHACVLHATGDVDCWGLNADHQTGQITGPMGFDDVHSPAHVPIPI